MCVCVCVCVYIYIYIIYKRGCGPQNTSCGPQNTSCGPRVGEPWSKTKRLVIAMVCQLHFNIIRLTKKHIFNGTHQRLMICALTYVDVSLRAKKHTHHKPRSIISHYHDGWPVSKRWDSVPRTVHEAKTQLIHPLKISKSSNIWKRH